MTELEKCELAKSKGFTYNPETGEVKGIKGTAITKKGRGYIRCQVCDNGKKHNLFGHRLAWYLYYGELPKNQIDHIDGDKTNNRIENLRDVTHQVNGWNRLKAKGYSWHKGREKFISHITLNKKLIHLGFFDTAEQARAAYLEAKEKYHVIL